MSSPDPASGVRRDALEAEHGGQDLQAAVDLVRDDAVDGAGEGTGEQPQVLAAAVGVGRSLMRVGRAVRCEGRWAALVTGGARPRIGEVFRLFMHSRREWRDVVVTEVLDGRPGRWLVRKRFLGTGDNVRPMCVHTVCAEQPSPTAMSQAAT